jgi:hypothetical protein
MKEAKSKARTAEKIKGNYGNCGNRKDKSKKNSKPAHNRFDERTLLE